MKKFLFLPFVVLLAFSCREEEIEMYDRLEPDEQTAIRNMGTADCIARLTDSYNNWKTKSGEIFTNTGYDRNDGYKFTNKGDSGDINIDIGIWKQTPSEMYFIITDQRLGTGYFLRYTKDDNEEIIDDLLQAHCTRPEIYISGINSSTLTMTNEYTLPIPPNQDTYTDTYSINLDNLAFFANFSYSRTKKTYDSAGVQTGTTINYNTAKLENLARNYDVIDGSGDRRDWSNASFYTQKFCVIKNGNPYRFTRERNVEGFKIDQTECTTTPPGGWDLNVI